MISCRDWWPWTKPGYITMTQRQSKHQWSGGIVAHAAPKNSECKNPLEKFLPQFFVIKTESSSFIIFQRAKLSMQSITHLCWCNWRTFWKKTLWNRSPRGSCSCTTSPSSPGTCNPEETGLPGLPVSSEPTLFSRLALSDLPPVSWTENTIERSPFFVQHGGYCCRGDLIGQTTFWVFFWVTFKS